MTATTTAETRATPADTSAAHPGSSSQVPASLAEAPLEDDPRAVVAVLGAQDESPYGEEEEEREDSGEDWRQDPRDDDGRHALHKGKGVGRCIPKDAAATACAEGEADDTADGRVGGGYGKLVQHAEHAIHVDLGVVDERVVVCDALVDGLGHVGSQQNGAEELEDAGDDQRLLDGDRLGANGRAERVGHVIRACMLIHSRDDNNKQAKDDEKRYM
eukprot:scaffold447427_cov48-Prasinocladus_malaysianus.AAC.1